MNISANNKTILASFIDRETKALWQRMELAYDGGERFKKHFLWRYEREDDQDWLQRLNRSVYENHLRDLISRRQSIIFGRAIGRTINSRTLPWSRIAENVDGARSSWDDFVRKCFVYSQIYGFAAVLVDIPSAGNITALQDAETGVRPLLRLLHPRRLLNWSMDDYGNFEWATIQTADRPVEKLLLTRESISRHAEESSNAESSLSIEGMQQSNPAAVVPMVILSDEQGTGDSLGKPSLQSACELSILYFNQSNWYDQLLYKTNYSTLAATPFAGSHEEAEIVVGSGDVFWVPEGGMIPSWISPDTGPADVFERRLAYMRRRIYELAALDVGHVEDKSRDLSGIAYSIRRLPTEEMAMRISRNLKRFEERLIKLIYSCAGHQASVDIKYPLRYGVRPLRDAMNELKAIEDSRLLPPAVKAHIASQIVFTEGFADLNDDQQRRFEADVRQYNKSEYGGNRDD